LQGDRKVAGNDQVAGTKKEHYDRRRKIIGGIIERPVIIALTNFDLSNLVEKQDFLFDRLFTLCIRYNCIQYNWLGCLKILENP
jgi:hypothetical protein